MRKLSVVLPAYAKINISLDVTGVRDNGYHEVRMIMQSISLKDEVAVSVRPDDRIVITCDDPRVPVDERNLCFKAAKLFRESFGVSDGIDIDIKKRIPMAAGLAGGSTDAAAVLKGMAALLRQDVNDAELMKLGVRIGADVPFCILSGTALAEGIGEELTVLEPLKHCFIVTFTPSVEVSTAFVYKKLDEHGIDVHPDVDGQRQALERGDFSTVVELMGNVLEPVTLSEVPVISEIKNKMMECGALGAMMSGSGPTVFGVFSEKEAGIYCNTKLKEAIEGTGFITETVRR